MYENSRLAVDTATKRLILIDEANGMWRFVEESHHDGDEYTGPYFAQHISPGYMKARTRRSGMRGQRYRG